MPFNDVFTLFNAVFTLFSRCLTLFSRYFHAVSRPSQVIQGHSHWVCAVKHNAIYDQLILSAGTDNVVKLWKMISVSSVVTSEGAMLTPLFYR